MELITEVLFQTYQFLASIKVPGFNISFIQLFFGVAGVFVSIGFAKSFFNLGGVAFHSIGRSIRGGNNKNIKISSERKGDTH